jgi:hypothetical protein
LTARRGGLVTGLGFAAAFVDDFAFFGNAFVATFFRIGLRFLMALLRGSCRTVLYVLP